MVDAYKFFDETGVNAYNLIATIGSFVLAIGILMTLVNAIVSRENGPEAGHDPWLGESLEWFALSPPEPAQLRRPARRARAAADARHPRRNRAPDKRSRPPDLSRSR